MIKLIHKNLSYKITGICFQVHRELGRFCREKQYADKLEELLKQHNINYQREYELKNLHNASIKGNKVDFLIADKIILDTKAKKFITKDDYLQMQRYLQSADLELGFIVNFRNTFLKPKRILNSKYSGYSDVISYHWDRFKGLTLIEMAVSFTILSVTILLILGMVLRAQDLIFEAREKTQAVELAQEGIEAVRSKRAEATPPSNLQALLVFENDKAYCIKDDGTIKTTSGNCNDAVAGEYRTLENIKFKIQVVFSNPSGCGDPATPVSSQMKVCRHVEVTTSWKHRGKDRSVKIWTRLRHY